MTWADMSLLLISERRQEFGGVERAGLGRETNAEQGMQDKQQRLARRVQPRDVGAQAFSPSARIPTLLSPSNPGRL